jgi:CheY-like chemotaxis protein/HPt (histidine-containing phosphotransfer) domain-containing protein/anti-sigma regulatory factor (Ser/Thr protein kinase)
MNEMILRESEDTNILEYADSIKSSGKTLLNLINSILDFSKIEDGKMEIVPVDYKTAEVVRYLYNSVAERAAGKGLEFTVKVDPLIPVTLHGDDMRLTQVIMNLLTNAVKYTNEGKIELSFKNAGRNDENVKLHVEVKDSGIGIKSEDMPRLFESFERLDVEKNRSIEGTGLGMSIVTRLLSMMGSKLYVESEYGVGSKFYFDIKQEIVDDEIIGEFSVSSESEKINDPANRYRESFHAPNANILIVDDTKMNLKVAVNLLKKTMMNIDTSISGTGALALCQKVKYDIILMDQRMPGLDGTQTLLKLREDTTGLNTGTPVICLTADAISGARDTYVSQGFTDYLSKPINSRQLEKMLTKYLPADKVIYGEAPVVENTGSGFDVNKYGVLSECGMDLESAYKFCQGEENLFKEVLAEYVAEAPEKKSRILSCYDKKDWKNYSIYTHSLKSTSKLIGAKELSELAERMEKASNDSKEDIITKEHERMISMYDETVSCIRRFWDESGEDPAASIPGDDEILEFSPQ